MSMYPDSLPSYPPRRPSRLPVLIGIFAGLLGGWLITQQVERRGRGRVDAVPRTVSPRSDLTQAEKTTIEIFEAAAPSVVFITTMANVRQPFGFSTQEIPAGAGSGFVWDSDGHIVTNFHVVLNADQVKVTLADHSSWNARVIGTAPDKDLAVLRIDAPADQLPPLAVGTSHDLRVGQTVFAIGNPFGLDQTLTTGVVSALGRSIISVTNRTIEGVIQTDAAINPGNSGGPLLDSAGRLIGVNTQIVSRSGASAGIGFAVPVDTVNEVVPQLIAHGRIIRPQMGVIIVADELARRYGFEGVLIQSVSPGSSAEKAGLRGFSRREDGELVIGDMIVQIDERVVRDADDLLSEIEKHRAGDVVRVKVVRDEKTLTFDVTLRLPES